VQTKVLLKKTLLLILLVAPLQETAVAKKSSGIPEGVKIAGCLAGFAVGGALLMRHLLKKPTGYVPEESDIYSPEELEAMREAQGRSYGNLIGAGVAGAFGVGFGASLAFGGDSDDDDDDDDKDGGMNGKPGRDLVKDVFGKTEQEIAAMGDTERDSLFGSTEGISLGFYYGGLLNAEALLKSALRGGYQRARDMIDLERKKVGGWRDIPTSLYGGKRFRVKRNGSIHFHVGKVDVKEFMADQENSGSVFLVPVRAGEKLDDPDLSVARMMRSNSYADNVLAAALPAAIARKVYFQGANCDLLGALAKYGALELDKEGQINKVCRRLLWDEFKSFDCCSLFRHSGVSVCYGKDFAPVTDPKSQRVTLVYAPIFDPRPEVVIEHTGRGFPRRANELASRGVTKFFAQSAYLLTSMATFALVKHGSGAIPVKNKLFVPVLDANKFGNSLEVTLDALNIAAKHACDHELELHVLWPVDSSVVERYTSWEDYIFSSEDGLSDEALFAFYKVITDCNQYVYDNDYKRRFTGSGGHSNLVGAVKRLVENGRFVKVIWHDS